MGMFDWKYHIIQHIVYNAISYTIPCHIIYYTMLYYVISPAVLAPLEVDLVLHHVVLHGTLEP